MAQTLLVTGRSRLLSFGSAKVNMWESGETWTRDLRGKLRGGGQGGG